MSPDLIKSYLSEFLEKSTPIKQEAVFMDKPSRTANISLFWKWIDVADEEKFICTVPNCGQYFSRKKSSNPSKAIKRHFAKLDHQICLQFGEFNNPQNTISPLKITPMFKNDATKRDFEQISQPTQKVLQAVGELDEKKIRTDSDFDEPKSSPEAQKPENDLDQIANKVVEKLVKNEKFISFMEAKMAEQSDKVADKILTKLLKMQEEM